ncbi:hypothetical protein A4A49_25041 [Nicotiana attenuata]|uniref:Protein yippee-like n=1 Tax=Nicotiana attenuata TaxID=49451 RepID=A0A1J6ICL3_NICAT|nr:hypothetical protein A4A49_56573 [Nicotiana attenuata]OIT18737.1 hypothetical protein A4A49_25041 [Nicotiana attenuata]
MERLFTVENDQVRGEDFIHCNVCKTRIGTTEDHIENIQNETTGVLSKVFNVQVLDDHKYVEQDSGNTVADIYCVKCGMLLGLKLITVPRQTLYVREGRFLMKLNKLVYWGDVPMFFEEYNIEHDDQVPNNQVGGVNDQVPNNQVGDADEHDHNPAI